MTLPAHAIPVPVEEPPGARPARHVGCIPGPACDPDDDGAMARLRPATTYLG